MKYVEEQSAVEYRKDEFLITTNKSKLNLDAIYGSYPKATGPKEFQEMLSSVRSRTRYALEYFLEPIKLVSPV